MKIERNFNQNAGNALVITLFLVTILAVSIAGYLSYTNQQSLLGFRSQTWNMALAVSEAGVEEGLSQLNNNYTNLASDGWTASGSIYSISRSLGNGNSYTVSIDYSNAFAPDITSRAFVTPPALAQNSLGPLFAVGGGNTTESSTISRAIRVKCSKASLFLGAMVARHKIDMNGNNVLTDSFDSADPAKSTSAQYDPTKAGNRGDVASNDGVVNTVAIGNANIYGKVYVGPGGSATVGVNGGIGEHSWQATHTGIEDGWFFNNANYTFPIIKLPYNSGLDPGPRDIVTIAGVQVGTNTVAYNNVSTLPVLSAGQSVGPITTNTSTASTSIYPGSKPGLTTNTTYQTVNTYPGAQPGMLTNYIGFATVTTHPGAQPQLTTNCSSTQVKVKNQPTSGWCGPTPWQTGNDVNWWYYYPVASYTYASQLSYTYPIYTYQYTTYTYSYVVYQSQPIYETNHYDHVLANGDYYTASDLTGKTLVTGNARLVMPNGLKMSGNDQVTIAPGGSLALYSDGNDLTIGGNGFFNTSGYAANLGVYATPNVKNFTLNGNGEFKGVLVAPEADIKMNGGGHAYEDFIGALLVNSVVMNGHFNFHYDEALSRLNTNGRFLIVSWDEIK